MALFVQVEVVDTSPFNPPRQKDENRHGYDVYFLGMVKINTLHLFIQLTPLSFSPDIVLTRRLRLPCDEVFLLIRTRCKLRETTETSITWFYLINTVQG